MALAGASPWVEERAWEPGWMWGRVVGSPSAREQLSAWRWAVALEWAWRWVLVLEPALGPGWELALGLRPAQVGGPGLKFAPDLAAPVGLGRWDAPRLVKARQSPGWELPGLE